MKLKFSLIALFIFTLGFAQNKGTITGTITDKDIENETLPFASVVVKGTKTAANADENGLYTLSVSEGTHTLVFGFLGYHSAEVQVTVKAGETVTVNQKLASTSVQLQDVVIEKTVNREKESALLLEQKKAVEIKQSIGAQELSRKGISDVEEGLTKITGITKVGSRGIFVRGLEDRYNSLLVNDLSVPSNSPFQKIIPLDLFPTDIVGVVDVYKTFSPNIYGDFAGGTFNIATSKGGNAITKLSIGVGYTTNNNLSDFKLASGADSAKGFFGFTSKDRQMPSIFGDIPSNKTLTTQESKDSFKSGYNVNSGKSPLNSSIGILHSERFDLKNDAKFGYLFSLNFDNSYSFRYGDDNTALGGAEIVQITKFKNSTYNYKTNTSALVGLNYKANRFELTSTTFYLKSTEDIIQDQLGYENQQVNNQNYLIRTNQLNQSDYFTSQLYGKYFLNENKDEFVRAGVSYSNTQYQQPDRKFFAGTKEGDQITTNAGGNNFLRQYFDVNGNMYFSGMAEYVKKFGPENAAGDKKYQLTAGYNGYYNKSETSYRFVTPDQNGQSFTTAIDNVDTEFNKGLDAGAYNLRESSNAQYRTELEDITNAGYASALFHFGEKWEINAGLRFEQANRTILYRENGAFDDPYLKLDNSKSYVLPAASVKYALTEKANLRFAAGQTYTKPVLIESLAITYINPDGTSVSGNPYLVNSDNFNVDLKYEFFPTNTETFSVGVFGKQINNAIERTFQASASGNQMTFVNSGDATLYGLEMDFILDLARVSDSFKDLSWGFNTSLMATNVDVNPTLINSNGTVQGSIETHRDRQLQGASNWLINSDLKYQFGFSEKWTNNISLVYGVFGKRIYSVGTAGLDHVYELPVSKLDLVWGSKINEHFDVKLSADNILNPKVRFEYGDENLVNYTPDSYAYKNYKRGVGFSMSLNYTF